MSQVKKESTKSSDTDGYVVRIRGLPWSASKDDIVKFFDGCNLKNGPQGIHLTMSREGRPSGEAYIEFETEDDVQKAMAKDNEHLGSRYIEVFRSGESEMEWALRKCGLDGEEAFGDACVRLRGLPFGCSKEEIAQFFTGLEIVRNGITLPIDHQGRSTGEAYVQFSSQEIAEKAMGKHKEKIGHRYIEIFKSSLQEIRSATGMGPMRMSRSMGGGNRMTPYDKMDRPSMYGGGFGSRGRGFGGRSRGGFNDFDDIEYDIPSGGRFAGRMGGGDRYFGGRSGRDSGTGHRVHMRGLPYRAVERDIYEFFAPLNPVSIDITSGPGGRPSGEADVDFATHEDALKAMKHDKEKIQHRYIELFLRSEPEPFRRSGGNNFGMDMRGGSGYDMRGGGFGSDERGYGRNSGGGGRFMSDDGFGAASTTMARGGMGSSGGYGASADRGFNDGFSSSGSGAGSSMGFSGADRFADRGYSQSGSDRFGVGMGRNMASSDRSYGGMGGGNDFRNGNGPSSGGGGFGNTGSFAQDNDSEFYGSGKLFGGENFQQSPNMMGGNNNYTSFSR